MLGHAVAHMALEAVAGMGGADLHHQAVAHHLGDDRCGGDGEHEGIPRDHRLAIAAGIDLVAAVDEDEPRPHRQRRDRARQCPQRRLPDVVAIDAGPRAEGDADLGGGADARVELLALHGGELLGIVEAAGDPFGIENDCRGHHRPRQGTASGLVAPRHRKDTALDGGALAPKARPQRRLGERQAGGGRLAVRSGPDGDATHGAILAQIARGSQGTTRTGNGSV